MKKILIISISAVLMLVTISFASAIDTNTDVEKKESPLYKIRTRQAIREKIGKIIENIKTKFLGERIFFLPLQWLGNKVHLFPRIATNEVPTIIECYKTQCCKPTSDGHTCSCTMPPQCPK